MKQPRFTIAKSKNEDGDPTILVVGLKDSKPTSVLILDLAEADQLSAQLYTLVHSKIIGD